eukprot:CAMPEP_0171065194 /NCGR_PEP_ID=MMETSP0766_2-20121228/6706_1 /TAXON_ID=439317 /ORGANISM="Gambierdiscus australes, Strain CAWD 149" /LENGTH=116 /DNA_ID=CAMNT_0011521271 /DNA_START=64 /DNA_END=412 /DNA_ORIENTATION=-
MGDDWMMLDDAALTDELVKLVKEIGSIDTKPDTDLIEAGVDSMDMSAIQKKMIQKLPGYDIPDDKMVFFTDDAKTVDAIVAKLKTLKKKGALRPVALQPAAELLRDSCHLLVAGGD